MNIDFKLSVVVVTKNEEKCISSCLDSIFAQQFHSGDYEVILVDAGSCDRTQEIAREYPLKLVVDNYGTLGHQRNMGVRLARGKYVAFIDADCYADTQWLSRQVDLLDKSPHSVVAVTGPNLIMDNDPPVAKTIAYMQQTLLGSGGSPQSYLFDHVEYVTSAPNCNAIYRRKVLLNYLYDNGFSYGEDAELNYRLRRDGYKFLYNPAAIVWHHRVATTRALGRKMFFWGFAMAKISRKHKRLIRWFVCLPPALVIYLVTLMPMVLSNYFISWYFFFLVAYVLVICTVIVQVLWRQRNVYALRTAYLLPVQYISYGLGMLLGLCARGSL